MFFTDWQRKNISLALARTANLLLTNNEFMNKLLEYIIPSTYHERKELRETIFSFVRDRMLSPPLSMNILSDLADQIINQFELEAGIKAWIMVEINNGVWRETLAAIPYEKRVLLLPKCLSNSAKCEADVDEVGLSCNFCNNCPIPDLQDKADELGMMSIVAEGFTSVVSLVENGIVDAVVGVSCLDSLEKAFPLLVDNAIPGVAIPLNKDGCKDTTVDCDYVSQLMCMKADEESNLLDYDNLKQTIKKWFTEENLMATLTPSTDLTSSIVRQWIGGSGKRWRPYLLAATYMALSGHKEVPYHVQLAAIAVECFHKASLVHDDIQDNDSLRYGEKTVNAAHGVPIAINVGDMFLGEGYRLLARCGYPELIKVASEAHIALCKGQGTELEWSASPRKLSMDFVLDIFSNKTVPAFSVSLIMGLICAENDLNFRQTLEKYSRALGIAYQLKDDVEDFHTDEPLSIRPSAVLAVLCRLNPDEDFIQSLLYSNNLKSFLNQEKYKALLCQALDEVQQMAEEYQQQALDALHEISNTELKRLLFRVTKRILN